METGVRNLKRIAATINYIKVIILAIVAILPYFSTVRAFLADVQDRLPDVTTIIAFILSPYFTLTLIAGAFALLFWRNWPVYHPPTIEFPIEMLEEKSKQRKN